MVFDGILSIGVNSHRWKIQKLLKSWQNNFSHLYGYSSSNSLDPFKIMCF